MAKKRKGNSQGLKPRALKAKRARDLAAANTREREIKRAQNQARGQRSDSDLHHTSDGRIVRTSIAYNRNTHGRGEVGRRKKRGKKKRSVT